MQRHTAGIRGLHKKFKFEATYPGTQMSKETSLGDLRLCLKRGGGGGGGDIKGTNEISN